MKALQKIKALIARLKKAVRVYRQRRKANLIIKRQQQAKLMTQSQRFVSARPAWAQYFLDVFALAFLLAVLFVWLWSRK